MDTQAQVRINVFTYENKTTARVTALLNGVRKSTDIDVTGCTPDYVKVLIEETLIDWGYPMKKQTPSRAK